MTTQNEHGRLIAAAAKAVLAPLGCKRKGQSRLWFSDERYWLITIEFQPSAWSKGSYLNVGVRWLWHPRPGTSLSYRPVDFIPFKTAEQFSPRIKHMADRAAGEVLRLRERFKSFDKVHEYLISHATLDGWPIYDAAIVAGLVEDWKTSRQLFERIEAWETFGYDWQLNLKAESGRLAAKISDPIEFHAAVTAIIDRNRKTMRLPPDPSCLRMPDSTTEP